MGKAISTDAKPTQEEAMRPKKRKRKAATNLQTPKSTCKSEKPRVTGVTCVTASNGAGSSGNTEKSARVTGVTAPILESAVDPRETPPPEGVNVKDQHPFPSAMDRPSWGCYEDWCGENNAKRPGVYFHGMTKEQEPKPLDEWVCDPLRVEATTRDTGGHSFGMMLRLRDKLGNWKKWNMPARMLAGKGADGMLSELLDLGLKVDYNRRTKIPAYINAMTPRKTMWAAAQVGWHEKVFVLPSRVIGDDQGDVFFQSETTKHETYAENGTLDDWRAHVAARCVGNPLLLFSVSMAFAGPLLKLCNMDGAGFHVFGSSSCGKSTGAKLAASVWGDYEKYKKTWKATSNGLEGVAFSHNDGLLVLDEMGDGDGREVDQTIYALGNGKGKQRATVTGSAKEARSWRIVTLSNGEKTLEAHLAASGLTVKAGQLARLLQIPVFGRYGAFDDLHGHPDGGAFADGVMLSASKHFGTAGIAYLKRLTAAVNADDDISVASRKITRQMTEGELSSQEGRAAAAFALVATAGELATEYGITGWRPGAAVDAARTCFSHWRGHRGGGGDTEKAQILRSLSDFISTYGDARFTETHSDLQLRGPRAGYWRERENGREWLLSSAGMREAVKGFEVKRVTGALVEAGWLMPGTDKPQAQVKSGGVNGRFYVIRLPDGGYHGA